MNNTYLNDTQIQQIADICNRTFTKANKAKLTELGRKYNLTFNQSKQINMNMFWQKIVDKLRKDSTAKDTISGQSFDVSFKEGNFMSIKEMTLKFIKENYDKDYKFLCDFDPEKCIDELTFSLNGSNLRPNKTIAELLEVDNYFKYFNEMFGITSIDKKSVKTTKRIADFFNDLTENVPNKEGFFIAVIDYLKTNDLTELHNRLHKTN